VSRRRIVSLLPSATEIVAALGLEDSLVGRSHECDSPPGVERLPVCTAPKIDSAGSSLEIHGRVEALLSEALSVYRVDSRLLEELGPTHVVTQVHCDVCAVSLSDVERALAGWTRARPKLVALHPSTLDDVFDDIRRVAEALGVSDRGAALVARLSSRMAEISETARGLADRPRVATIEWLSPPMAAGNWIPEMIERAGGENLFGERGRHSPWLAPEALRDADPDVIVVFPCGFSLERVEAEAGLLYGLPGWETIAAVENGAVFLADGNQYFNRPGPRLVETLEILAEILHPETFSFGHQGTGWKRLDPEAKRA
jgi:iron complex transport system substrate-binding protein